MMSAMVFKGEKTYRVRKDYKSGVIMDCSVNVVAIENVYRAMAQRSMT
jgi:hypothetical protein